MNNGNKRKLIIRITAVACCLILMFAIVVSLAYFTKVKSVKNTFVLGDIEIELTETQSEFNMQPECKLYKNPLLRIVKGSIDSWIFIKAEESPNLKNYISYEIRTGEGEWSQLADDSGQAVDGVYYLSYSRNTRCDDTYYIIKDNQVEVIESVTKEMLDGIREGKESNPTLSFTGYGVEKADGMTAYEAWLKINEQ